MLLFVEPHGAGKQWRWLLTSRLLNIAVSRGKFNDIIAQVRFSSEYLWSQAWCGDALSKVHTFLMSIFGEFIHLQLSEVHLCADVVGYDFSQCNYETQFVTRVRKNEAIYGADSVALDYHRVSTLAFSKHKAPISCGIYNKTLEIKQKSGKTWFYDLWRKHGWDETADVWRVEFRFKRSRWPVHPIWVVVQRAFAEDVDPGLGPLVRERIREKNVERGIAATIGYISTLAAWLGGEYVDQDADVSLMLHWLSEVGPEYLESKQRDFVQEVRKKQKRYGNTEGAEESEAAS